MATTHLARGRFCRGEHFTTPEEPAVPDHDRPPAVALSHGRLMLTVLGGLAAFEKDLLRVRTAEGRARAKARDVTMGRS
jgi:Resolvase, N terminal domain